jgi:hypothetical protein
VSIELCGGRKIARRALLGRGLGSGALLGLLLGRGLGGVALLGLLLGRGLGGGALLRYLLHGALVLLLRSLP